MKKMLSFLVILLVGICAMNVEATDPKPKVIPVEIQALTLIRTTDAGTLGTLDAGNGNPYLSLMPYILDDGDPIMFISDLAVHTTNVNKKSVVSLCVSKPDKDGSVFNGQRATLDGKAVKITDEKKIAELKKNYVKKYKEAEDWIDFGDFNFYKIEVESIYYIGGFGEIHGIDMTKYRKEAKGWL